MSDQAKTEKPKTDHKKYLAFQFFANFIGVVVVVAFLAWIVFGLFGLGLFVLFLGFGASILSGCLTLACMILPTI